MPLTTIKAQLMHLTICRPIKVVQAIYWREAEVVETLVQADVGAVGSPTIVAEILPLIILPPPRPKAD